MQSNDASHDDTSRSNVWPSFREILEDELDSAWSSRFAANLLRRHLIATQRNKLNPKQILENSSWTEAAVEHMEFEVIEYVVIHLVL